MTLHASIAGWTPILAEATQPAVRELPISAHAIAVGSLLVGLYVWARGQGKIKLALALLGAIIGGATGYLALAPTLASLGLAIHPLIPAIGLALSTALVAALVLKVATAVATALVASLAITVAAFPFIAAAPDTGQERPEIPEVPTLPGFPPASPDRLASNLVTPTIDDETEAALRSAAEAVRTFVIEASREPRQRWSGMTFNQQILLVLTAGFGLVLGFAFGMILSGVAGTITTALAGSALVLASGAWLAALLGASPPSLPALAWIAVWLPLAVLGVVLQILWRPGKGTRRDRRERARADGA